MAGGIISGGIEPWANHTYIAAVRQINLGHEVGIALFGFFFLARPVAIGLARLGVGCSWRFGLVRLGATRRGACPPPLTSCHGCTWLALSGAAQRGRRTRCEDLCTLVPLGHINCGTISEQVMARQPSRSACGRGQELNRKKNSRPSPLIVHLAVT